MTSVVEGRRVIACDRCSARLDLGPARSNPYSHRTPSGWLAIGPNEHVCGLCSSGYAAGFARRFG